MTLSNHTLTLVALIAIGLSLRAIAFVVFAGGTGGADAPGTLTGDEAVGTLLGRIERIEQAVRTLNGTDRKQQYQIDGSVRRVALLRYDAFEDVGGRLSFSCAMLDEHGTGVGTQEGAPGQPRPPRGRRVRIERRWARIPGGCGVDTAPAWSSRRSTAARRPACTPSR